MIETHPFGSYIPTNGAKYLLLGSFAGQNKDVDPDQYWFYVTKRNQFWSILSSVYNRDLSNIESKKKIFDDLNLAISDIIYQCERTKSSNLDNNLINIVYNYKIISEILVNNNIEKIIFSSKFAESGFNRHFKVLKQKYPNINYQVLPSPSPRYATLSLQQKIDRYKEILPKF